LRVKNKGNNPLPERQNFYPTGKQGFPTRKILKSRFEIPRKNLLNLKIK